MMPPHALFDVARSIRVAGLSLSLICQQYADHRLVQHLNGGATLRCLFLDPNGEAVNAREEEQWPGRAPGRSHRAEHPNAAPAGP
jgi:hypothetical protein